MIDLCQCEPSLRARPKPYQSISWTVALNKAARQLGYYHHLEVPDDKVEGLKELAHTIRGTIPC